MTDLEVKSLEQGQVQKLIVTCVAEAIVDIISIDNPQAANLEYRFKKPKEYLKARVRRVEDARSNDLDNHASETVAGQIAKDYNRVREYLIEGFGTDVLPPFARQNLADALPAIDASQLIASSDDNNESFWKTVYLWQTYAYTLREGYQTRLASDRNELLIAGALKQGGPLNLPVHVTDLLPADRQQVVQLEHDVQQEWLGTSLEPVLDFQALLVAANVNAQDKHGYTPLQRAAEVIEFSHDSPYV